MTNYIYICNVGKRLPKHIVIVKFVIEPFVNQNHMLIARRNFIQAMTLGLATVATGFTNPLFADNQVTKTLKIQMPSPDGKYVFHVDGKKQFVNITNEEGRLDIPLHSCTINYMAEDGTTHLSVYIDRDTRRSFLLPGMVSNEEAEMEWGVVLLGNPIKESKIFTQISGPAGTYPVVEIIDMQGRTLIKEKVKKTMSVEGFMFDVQRFSKGMLLVKVSHNDFSQTIKALH